MTLAVPAAPRAAIAPLDVAALCLIATVWGVNNVLAKYVLLYLPPFLSSSIRFGITAAVLFMFWRPAAGAFKPLSIAGLLTATHFGIQAVGLWLARDLAPMVIAMQLWIPATAIFGSIFLGERLGARRILGIVISFAGIVILAAAPSIIPQLLSFALVGLASVIYGGVSVFVRRSPPVHPLAYQAWIAIAAVVTLGPLSLITETNHAQQIAAAGWGPLAALTFSALVSSVVANALMFRLVQKYEVARTTPYMFATPIIAIALGAMFLGDTLTPQFLVGGAVTMAGVIVTALAERSFKRVTRPAE